MSEASFGSGTLYLVATPIGNLEDITLRALRVLKEVDLVAAEDTRHSRKLFNHYGIGTTLTSYHEHNEAAKAEKILAALRAGKSVAIISDAGTPAISDPGYLLVCRCREEGIAVAAVPGPSAVVAALSVSGLPVDRFCFEGFVPAKATARREALRRIAEEQRTAIFYEAPHRLRATLQAICDELDPERPVAVARELTKVHEELCKGTAQQVCEHFSADRVRGEIVLLVGPGEQQGPQGTVREALLRLRRETDLPMRQIVKQVAREFGLPGSEVYSESLKLKEEEE